MAKTGSKGEEMKAEAAAMARPESAEVKAAGKRLSRHLYEEHMQGAGELLRQFILGGQDGLVNVLGIILAVAVATKDAKVVLIAGLAATFAESISMAAVAYTSSKAARDHYLREQERELREIRLHNEDEAQEVRDIYVLRGFRGKLLDDVVKKISSDEKEMLRFMMREELGMTEAENIKPGREALMVGVSAMVGSLIPLAAFFFMPVANAVPVSLVISTAVLFVAGAVKAKYSVGNWLRTGFEMAAIGMLAAMAGYLVGAALGAVIA
ncbi:MAG: VIT1/CCC1 transporter family protein [Candidatus Burarchaeum sp.]|nr:VIT1/CCC1 transporter family protein [Candidatus Burarchaeum sp.]MDO8340079.1 VIT1/CCC1 transporter family protein [Candidatus Burarchaeum sp.]